MAAVMACAGRITDIANLNRCGIIDTNVTCNRYIQWAVWWFRLHKILELVCVFALLWCFPLELIEARDRREWIKICIQKVFSRTSITYNCFLLFHFALYCVFFVSFACVTAFCNTVKIKRSECDGNCILPWISEVQIGWNFTSMCKVNCILAFQFSPTHFSPCTSTGYLLPWRVSWRFYPSLRPLPEWCLAIRCNHFLSSWFTYHYICDNLPFCSTLYNRWNQRCCYVT